MINLDGKDVGAVISKTCVQRSASTATVRVWVNGKLVKEKTASVGKKGDSLFVLDLIRANGKFTAP